MSLETQQPLVSDNSPPESPVISRSHSRVPTQLIAWAVLLVSFGLFCALVFTVISVVTDFLSHSVQYRDGTVQAVKDRNANVFILHRGQPKETLVRVEEPVKEGDEIRTDKSSDAIIILFDRTRIDLTPGSRIRLEESHIDIKNFRRNEKHIAVAVLEGVVSVTVAPFAPLREYNSALVRALIPPEGTSAGSTEILFNDPMTGNYADGTFTLSVSRSAESGVQAWLNNKARKPVDVRSNDRTVSLGAGQRVSLEGGRLGDPGSPTERQIELIENGSFINGIDSWKAFYEQGSDKGQIDGLIQFDAERIDDGIQPRVRLVRLDPKADGNFAETSLAQEINRDVNEYDELWFSIKMKLISQSLPGGGQEGAEYPLFVKIFFSDKGNNQQQEYFQGFYSKAADSRSQVQDQLNRSKKLAQDEWTEFRFNLYSLRNKPGRILRIVVGSSGHLYDSYFTDISLIAR